MVAPYGGVLATLVSGAAITRPSFGRTSGTPVGRRRRPRQRWQREDDGIDHAAAVDITAVNNLVRGAITDLQVAPDGVRIAMVVDGQLVFAVVATNAEGRVMLTGPRIAALQRRQQSHRHRLGLTHHPDARP